ncbi:MAG: PfkB family carbohydrate kinase [Candidatus Eisenbacteria bacterium]|nr:PfkB family carbohydrate kinase [Candidatus Eisenbacteria bacterium]
MKIDEPKRRRLEKIAGSFPEKKVLVIGDLMLDEYVYGSTDRISREAPVLILTYTGSLLMPGGAGNACANVSSLGATAIPVGVVGRDAPGARLLTLLGESGIATESVASCDGFETVEKTRILAGGFHCAKQQVIRIDRGRRVGLERRVENLVLERALDLVARVDAVLFSDYGYGVVSERVRGEVMRSARAKRKPVCVDSRFHLPKFKGATVATPNEAEAGQAAGILIKDRDTLASAGKRLVDRLDLRNLLITQGSSGMTVFEKGKLPVHIPIFGSDEIADVTGAGDTVAAAVSLSLSCGATIVEASCVATYAGSVVVMKRGTATASTAEIVEAMSRGRIGGLKTL